MTPELEQIQEKIEHLAQIGLQLQLVSGVPGVSGRNRTRGVGDGDGSAQRIAVDVGLDATSGFGDHAHTGVCVAGELIVIG